MFTSEVVLMWRHMWLLVLVGEEGFIEQKASRQRRREEKKEKKDSFKSFIDTSDIDIMKVSVMSYVICRCMCNYCGRFKCFLMSL